MPNDTLILGGVVFDDFAAPSQMPFGGRHAVEIHKLPGGRRVVDLLGPDEADLSWSGIFFSDDAYAKAMVLNAMRQSGARVPLIFAGQFYLVVITEFTPSIIRMPVHLSYRITCLVISSPMAGIVDAVASSITSLVRSDLSAAMALAA